MVAGLSKIVTMSKFVHDVKTNRWVIIAPGRVSRPHDNLPSPPRSGDPSCPFEPANDPLNVEVFRIGPAFAKASAGKGSWFVRVIKNKYPITDIHEVIIHSPSHELDIDKLPLEQVELILQTYRARFNFHRAHGQVLIFNNHDVHAGASIGHPHSQLVVVPGEIKLDTITREPVENVVVMSSQFTVYCPNFSQWPYEIWLTPNQGLGTRGQVSGTFGGISDEEIADLARLLQKILGFIIGKFEEKGAMKQGGTKEDIDVPYNYYIYHGKDWYLRIIPRLIHRAGFELGTGLSVNIIDPVQAAREYRVGLDK